MKHRVKMSKKSSRRLFRRTERLSKAVNLAPPPMRGGIRL